MSDGHELLNLFYLGINIENILYGIELLLYLKTIRILLSQRGANRRSSLFYALFSTIMLLSVTVWVATEAVFGQEIWVLDPDFPGGPYAYWTTNMTVWYMECARVEIVILQLMTDALMIYRCRIIWNSNRIVIVPIILWLITLALGILVAWRNSLPGENFSTGLSSLFGLIYWSISVVLNTVVSCMICYRVVRCGRTVRKHLGPEYASVYFSVATIVIESVLPYTLSGIVYLVSLGVRSPTFVAFVCVYILMMCISPQMLILRVAAGTAWNNDTFNQPGSILKFSPGTTFGSYSGGEVGSFVQTRPDMNLSDGRGRVRTSEV